MSKERPAFPLCNEHMTVLVFTGKNWCGNCQRIAGELDQLSAYAAQSDKFHFVQLDDSDSTMIPWFREFKVEGVPMFIMHDPQSPQNARFIFYDGNRIASEIIDCVERRACTGRQLQITVNVKLVDHQSISGRDENLPKRSQEQQQPFINVCPKHPSFIVFTSKNCGACHDMATKIEQFKTQHAGHVQHFDADDSAIKFDALKLEYVPCVLRFNPQSNELRKIPTSLLEYPNQFEEQPIYPVAKNIIRPEANCPVMMVGECPVMMVGECPVMMGGECPAMTATQAAQGESVAIQVFDASVMNPRAMNSPETIMDALGQHLKQAMCDNIVVDICRSCPTFFVFTGTNWCTECQMFVPELIKLKQNARCGTYHVNHFDTQIGIDDFSRRVCRIFEIINFPTVLLFDPKTFTFVTYRALLRFKDLKQAPEILLTRGNVNHHQRKDVPRELSFRVLQPVSHNDAPIMRIRLCPDCPSILIFAIHIDKYQHATKQDGKGLHVMTFEPSNVDSRPVFEAFKINTIPKVLIYIPHMGNFYVFDGAHKDVPANASAALKQVKGRVWHDTPTIILKQ